ncbi:MAG: hypothetical protein J3K34DRAFT_428658 [Monoraphidium minutum]|nr:MAG: hypothetical protein J3K34DRAFT_428658 [Monoraphidium minutum]
MLGGALPPVLSALRAKVPASEASKQLSALVRTFDLSRPLPGLQPCQWRGAAALLLGALSWERLPAMRPAFSRGRPPAELLALLQEVGLDKERYFALLELLHEEM